MSNIKYNEETGLCTSIKINPLGQQCAYVGNDNDCNMVLWAMRLGGICRWVAANDYNKRYRMQSESPQDFLVVSQGMIADVKTNLVMPIPELKLKKGINDFVFGSALNHHDGDEMRTRWHWGAWTALEDGKKRIVPYERRSGQITQQHLLLAKMLKKTLDFC